MQSITVGNLVIGEGAPKICAPLTGKTAEVLRQQCEDICNSKADLAEWRVDFFGDILNLKEVNDILPKIKQELGSVPLIFTFRTAAEGGEKEITLEDYVQLNRNAIESKQIDFIDVELFRGDVLTSELIELAKKHRVYTIISNHDFDKTPNKEEIIARLHKAIALGGDLPKIAVMPQSERDVLTLLDATLTMKEINPTHPIITMSMGSTGLVSRISGELFGSVLTFGAVGQTSAPGQISVDSLSHCIEILHRDC